MVNEVDVAAAAAAWLQSAGFEVYHEVTLGDWRADLVGKNATGYLVVVEAKVSLTWSLLEQAVRWKPYCNGVWVAVPGNEGDPGSTKRFAWETIHRALKIGILEIVGAEPRVREDAPLLSRTDDELLHALREEHKHWAPGGSPAGGQFTPHQAWLRRLAEYVAANVACTAEEAAEGSWHPFRTTEGAAGYIIKASKNDEIEGVHVGWRQRLFPTKEQAQRGM